MYTLATGVTTLGESCRQELRTLDTPSLRHFPITPHSYNTKSEFFARGVRAAEGDTSLTACEAAARDERVLRSMARAGGINGTVELFILIG